MNQHIFEIQASDVKNSNEQLMQLWATFLKEGKIGWQYTPYKNEQENIIFVGFMCVHHLSINYEVNFYVSRNNTVQKVILTRQDNSQITEQEREYLIQVDTERKKLKKQIFYVQVQFSIESFKGIRYFYPFMYQSMTMYCIDDKQYLDFAIKGFCKQQISEQVLELFEKIASFLSTQTNSTIEIQKMCLVHDLAKIKEGISSEKQEDENWMDDYPLLDSHFILSEYAKKILYDIVQQKNSKELNIILRASHHF